MAGPHRSEVPVAAEHAAVRFRPSRPPLAAVYLVLAAAVLSAAMAAGWTARALLRTDPPAVPRSPQSLALGPVRMAVSGDWKVEPVARTGVAGLHEGTSVAFALAPGLHDAHVLVSLAPTDHPTLVPAPLRSLLAEPLGTPRATTLAGAPAWSYGARPLSGDRKMELTVTPTTGGTLSVACIAGSGLWVAASGCAEGLQRMSLGAGGSLPPSADLALRERAPGVVERLDRRRVTLRAALRRAPTRTGQSRAAQQLAGAYAGAAAALKPVAPSHGPARRLIEALEGAAADHRALASAAADADPGRYARARRALTRSDAHLRAALAALRR